MSPQARYWLLTIPADSWSPPATIPDACTYLAGQRERGSNTGFEHWQLVAAFRRAVRLRTVKDLFGRGCHAEPSRSDAANEYVRKEDSAIAGTYFELGSKPIKRNSKTDWELVRSKAISGALNEIPADIYCRYFNNLTRISQWNLKPARVPKECFIFWGKSRTGKSFRAWSEASDDAYPKDPLSKFWDGYQGQEHVVCDEFRGTVDVAHLLRWTDPYPQIVHVKGSSVVLKAKKFWFTSNLDPRQWYPNLDKDTLEALLNRFTIVHFNAPLGQ